MLSEFSEQRLVRGLYRYQRRPECHRNKRCVGSKPLSPERFVGTACVTHDTPQLRRSFPEAVPHVSCLMACCAACSFSICTFCSCLHQELVKGYAHGRGPRCMHSGQFGRYRRVRVLGVNSSVSRCKFPSSGSCRFVDSINIISNPASIPETLSKKKNCRL